MTVKIFAQFFLFFHPDDESSEKKTFAKNGYGTTVSYPTI